MLREDGSRRVAVTGMGVVSGYGVGLDAFTEGIFAGRSAVTKITAWDASALPCQIAARPPDYDASVYFKNPKDARRFERVTRYAVTATRQALEQSGLSISEELADDTGVYICSGIGGLDTFHEQLYRAKELGAMKLSPFFIVNAIGNMPGGVVSIETGARGPSFCVVSACASSGHGIGEAMREIRSGRMKVMLAGGTEASCNEIGIGGFSTMQAVTFDFNDTPEKGSRPFDARRSGFVMGEGSAVLVLEDWEHAQARGAKILAEVVGYAATSDAHHFTAPPPDGRGAVSAMRRALADAGISAGQIGYINAHGTSTPLGDKAETQAIKTVFGEHAYKLKVSSTKSMHGHMLGAAAAIESVACISAFQRGEVPPTINQEEADPECDLNYVPNRAQPFDGEYAMNNTFGFGGHNAVVIYKKV
ncbi:beta-ketoacyl-ACP synthase II [bacterium]|nr:beta-ketoacyl-ACP synthase II [bacterium]